MNRFSLSIRFDPRDGALEVSEENLHPPLRRHRSGDKHVLVWGSPIADGRRSDAKVLAALSDGLVRDLNGSFLIFVHDPAERSLSIANDRFASLAFFWRMVDGSLWGSLSFKQLFDDLKTAGCVDLDPATVFEFLHMRRLFGCHTYERQTRYLDSASILTIGPSNAEPKVEKYWNPEFERESKDLAPELADALRSAVDMHASDGVSTGLMLSGGLDSRALLAASSQPPNCYTTCLAPNNESEVAAEAARAVGATHTFIERPVPLYNDVLQDAVFLTGGMQVYNECQFLTYGPAIDTDVVFLGLGLDVFFGGLYLPRAPVQWLSRYALHYHLKPLGADLAGAFMTGVSYRLKTSDPWLIVKSDHRDSLQESLRESIESVIAQGRNLGADGYDLWEFLHLHNFSQHYSFPMAASVRTFADCRCPALENRLFDLAVRLDAADKVNGEIYRRALNILNPDVMAIRNANTNLPARHSLRMQSLIKACRFVLRSRYRPSPPHWERSWPRPADAIAHNPNIKAAVDALPRSERLAGLEFLDLDKVADVVAAHHRGEHDHAVLLNLLVTIDTVLS